MNGKELVFRKPGEDSEGEGGESANLDTSSAPVPTAEEPEEQAVSPIAEAPQVVESTRIVIHEDD